MAIQKELTFKMWDNLHESDRGSEMNTGGNSNRDMSKIECYNCHKIGHMKKDSDFKLIMGNTEKICFYCKKPNHLIVRCFLKIKHEKEIKTQGYDGRVKNGILDNEKVVINKILCPYCHKEGHIKRDCKRFVNRKDSKN